MKNNDTQMKLINSLKNEENTIQNKDIGIDKFSKADKIFAKKDEVSQPEIKTEVKVLPGKRKTIYLSQNTIEVIKLLGSKLRLLDVESNDSKIIATALHHLNTLSNDNLIALTKNIT